MTQTRRITQSNDSTFQSICLALPIWRSTGPCLQRTGENFISGLGNFRFRRSRTENGIDCIAGVGIKVWGGEMVKVSGGDSYTSLDRGNEGVFMCASSGSKLMVYNASEG